MRRGVHQRWIVRRRRAGFLRDSPDRWTTSATTTRIEPKIPHTTAKECGGGSSSTSEAHKWAPCHELLLFARATGRGSPVAFFLYQLSPATMHRTLRASTFSWACRRTRSFGTSALHCSDVSRFIDHIGEVKTNPTLLKRDLFFNPNFFNAEEQSFLIRNCLKKLDAADPPRSKRRRKALSLNPPSNDSPLAQFLPDHAYDFDQVF